jgi:hypothetical protein
MESVMVEKFRMTLDAQLDILIPDTAIFDHPTIAALTEYLLDLIPWTELDVATAPAAEPDPAGTPGTGPMDMPAEEPDLEQVAGELRELLVQLGDIR